METFISLTDSFKRFKACRDLSKYYHKFTVMLQKVLNTLNSDIVYVISYF